MGVGVVEIKMNLSNITIGITSFLRHGYLRQSLHGIRINFSDCRWLVADDSDVPPPLSSEEMVRLSFDSGLGAKRNALIENTKTEYLLLASDDFVFDEESRMGVELLKMTLDRNPEVSVAAGRVNDRPYEGFLEYSRGTYLKEILFDGDKNPLYNTDPNCYKVDIAANYFLARTHRLIHWPESIKIGGEHGLWFLRMKQAGRIVVWVPGVNIQTQENNPSKKDSRYDMLRRRCWDGHNKMKQILEIKKYIDFFGIET